MRGGTLTMALHLRKLGGVLLGSLCAAGLLTWRFHLALWEAWHCLCQTALFMLGCWLLSGENATSPSAQRLVSRVCVLFTSLWLLEYVRVALIIQTPPAAYGALLGNTSLAYLHFCMAAAEAVFMQTVWHRLAPSWACLLLGTGQALLHARGKFRYLGLQNPSTLQVARIVFNSLAGFLGPYQLACLVMEWQRKCYRAQITAQQASRKQESCSGVNEGQASSAQQSGRGHSSAGEGIEAAAEVDCGATHDRTGCFTLERSSTRAQDASVANLQRAAALVQRLSQASYKPPAYLTHTVCVKLDTDLPYSSLPTNLFQRLQNVLPNNTAHGWQLSITDVAVRPGCICISMKVLQKIAQGSDPEAAARVPADVLAHAMLPELQNMLQASNRGAGLHQGMLQVGSSLVRCTWCKDKQAWDVSLHNEASALQHAVKPWLGISTALALRPASDAAGLLAAHRVNAGLLELVAEVQLWGVGKAADVEGWTPPQQHQACSHHFQHWFNPQMGDHAAPLKLLARRGDGYLPTQVLRLIPGSNDEYITAQVQVQVEECQLAQHDAGGAPSTLLLMDFELWQTEVLLSSSPLLFVPAAHDTHDTQMHAASAWWWCAADSTVAAGMAELQKCAQWCLLHSQDIDACTSITTYNKYVQDVGIWLGQVQRLACNSGNSGHARDSAAVPCAFQQPTLTFDLLHKLGDSLVQYAVSMKWQHMQQMITQQSRFVTQRAAGGSMRTSVQRWRCTMRAVLLGYPCLRDELLYKQQLGCYLRSLLFVSSSATAVIGMLWGLRVLAMGILQPHTWLTMGWFLLHMLALGTLLIDRMCKQLGFSTGDMGMAHVCVTLVYLYRVFTHTILTVSTHEDPRSIPTPLAWAATQLLLLATEQLPASQLLPAPWMMALSLLLEFPSHAVLLMRGSTWHPVACTAAAFVVIIGARCLLEAHLRSQLCRTMQSSACSSGTQPTRIKLE